MSVFYRAMRFLFWLLVLSWTVSLLRRAVGWWLRGAATTSSQSTPENTEPARESRRLVRDPVCGAHVAEVLAIPLNEGGELLHFCSTACRDQYMSGSKKLAANG